MAQINIMKLIREGREAIEAWEFERGYGSAGQYQAERARATAIGTAESIVMYYELEGGLDVVRELREALAAGNVDAARAAWERLVEVVTRRGSKS
jgi:hypothetical protein